MLDQSSKPLRGSNDPLSDMLRGLRLDGVDYGRCALKAPWGLLMPKQEAARFHFIGGAGCWLLTPEREWITLNPGDALLLPRGAEHQLASAPGIAAEPLTQYQVEPVCSKIFDVKGGGGGECTLLFCGSLTFNFDSAHPLLKLMPDMMRACELAFTETTIPHLLEAMGCEVTMNRVGSGGILARLADVLAASIIRAWVERACGDATGWLAAARHPDIGRVLAQIHLDPARDWSVEALAKVMGASRSSFADRFTDIVGETPARYVAQVRMHQARQWLMRDRLRIGLVARKLGYDSEASFSRAFKRVIGTAPSNLRAGG